MDDNRCSKCGGDLGQGIGDMTGCDGNCDETATTPFPQTPKPVPKLNLSQWLQREARREAERAAQLQRDREAAALAATAAREAKAQSNAEWAEKRLKYEVGEFLRTFDEALDKGNPWLIQDEQGERLSTEYVLGDILTSRPDLMKAVQDVLRNRNFDVGDRGPIAGVFTLFVRRPKSLSAPKSQ